MEKEQFQQAQQGSGSAESIGQERSKEFNQSADISQQEKQDIANQIGEDVGAVSSVKETGGLTGRDDQAGGIGEHMEQQNTYQSTDK